MKTSKHDTTPEEFELFKSECLRWIGFFGLTDWKVDFVHEKLNSDGYAECRFNGVASKFVIMALGISCSKYHRKFLRIEQTAFHEVCELLLYPLEYLGTARYVQPEEFEPARHGIIRSLENSVYKNCK
jgi:hypothetical protein